MKKSDLKQIIKEEIKTTLDEMDTSQAILLAAGLLQLHNFKYIYGKKPSEAQKSPIVQTLNFLTGLAKIAGKNVKDVISPEVEEFLKNEDKKLKK